MPVSPSFLGLIFLAPAALVALVAHTADTPSILGLSLPAVIFGAAWLLLGTAIAWRLVFPIWFLSFMCVLPGFVLTTMSFKIQLLSTSGAALILRIIGLHPEQHGAAIKLANAEVLVGQPCSGFRLLISLLAFAIFFAYMREGPRWGKLVLVISTAPLSLFVNSVRIFMIALVGEFFGNEAMHAFHDYSGYLVLVLAFAVLWQLSKVVKCEKFKAVLIS
jgi:exosortase